MTKDHRLQRAMRNLAALSKNSYPGRGIVQGLSSDGQHVVQIYWIMGRSENSRNRIFKTAESGRVYTEFADPSKGGDPKLVIYNAMLESRGAAIVSNGDHTDTVDDFLRVILDDGKSIPPLNRILSTIDAEPDHPNYTPRIAAMYHFDGMHNNFEMLVARKAGVDSEDDDGHDHVYHRYEREVLDDHDEGLGWCIHTYEGDGDPLPAFQGAPFLVPIGKDIDEIVESYWDALNSNHLVALAVKMIPVNGDDSVTKVRNKYAKA